MDPSTSAHSEVAMGHVMADELQLREGATIRVDDQTAQIDAIVNTDERNPEIARWVLFASSPSARIQECWVEFEPGQLEAGSEMLTAYVAPGTEGVEVRPWRRLDEFSRDPVSELANRVQRLAWLPAGLLVGLLIWLVAWFRRSELGLYRAVGSSGWTLWYMAQVETASVLGAGLAAGLLWTLAVKASQGQLPLAQEVVVAVRNAGSAALLALVVGPLGWLVTGRSSIADLLKDR